MTLPAHEWPGRKRLVIFALSALVYLPFSHWISTARVGTAAFLWGQLFYVFPLLAAVLATPLLVILLPFRKTRRFSLLAICLLLILCCAGGILLGDKVRMACMRSFARRSQPLIAAINRYENDHSSPPRSLNDLVLEYLAAVPSTGMMAYPDYEYHLGAEAEYAGNPWALSVETPVGVLNFDSILYFPNQNYPAHGHGGALERVEDWAYVHE